MVEFAYGGWGTNSVLGAPRNPFDGTTHRVVGGSSSGSAVAVVAALGEAAGAWVAMSWVAAAVLASGVDTVSAGVTARTGA